MSTKNAEMMAQMTGMWRSLTAAEQDKWLANNGLARAPAAAAPADATNALVLTPQRGMEVSASQGNSPTHPGGTPRVPKYMDKANPPRHSQALRMVDVSAQPEPQPPHPMMNVSGARVADGEVRAWFDELDANKNGWLSKDEFRQMYANVETFGAPLRTDYIEEQLKKMKALDDDRITYDEFALLVMHIAKA
jgi:hypothetical protein